MSAAGWGVPPCSDSRSVLTWRVLVSGIGSAVGTVVLYPDLFLPLVNSVCVCVCVRVCVCVCCALHGSGCAAGALIRPLPRPPCRPDRSYGCGCRSRNLWPGNVWPGISLKIELAPGICGQVLEDRARARYLLPGTKLSLSHVCLCARSPLTWLPPPNAMVTASDPLRRGGTRASHGVRVLLGVLAGRCNF